MSEEQQHEQNSKLLFFAWLVGVLAVILVLTLIWISAGA